MVLNDLADSFCHSQKNAGLKGLNSPKIAEPLDELGGIVLVESDVGEVDFEHGRARIANVEEHELRLAQVHRCQSACLMTVLVKDFDDDDIDY